MFGRMRSALAASPAADDQPGDERPRDAHEADAAAARPFELAAIDLTTMAGRMLGWIATDGERTSDWLNANERLVVHAMREVPLADELPDVAVPGTGDALPRIELDPASLLFAVPPPLPPNRHLRLHRRRVLIYLDMGDYQVSGQLHVRPGADAADYVLRGARTMVPLTDVELVHQGDPAFRRLLPVLIINARHVTRMDKVQQPSSASQPPPVSQPAASVPQATAAGPRQMPDAELSGALRLLLDAGLLTVDEFQAKRSALVARERP